ncbi:MAG TPA: CDP-alcohol phosphatidyltransferase family protein [Geobacterales bacterium]|nr:CDP-alcohol phosphatidyltransferase family protein [Geobacterales bacterium]
MLGYLRKRIEELLSSIAAYLIRINVEPNMLTLAGFLLSLISAVFFYFRNPILGAIFLAFTGIMDVLDGIVARKGGKETKLGNVLDSVLDRYSDFVPLAAIGLAKLADWLFIVLAIFGSMIPSYVRAKLELNIEQSKVKAKTIIGERADRIILLILGALFYPIYVRSIDIVLLIIFLFGNTAAILRLIFNLDNLR